MKKLNREYILKTVKDNTQTAVKVMTAQNAADYARAFYSDDIDIYESAFIILLNRANNTIGWAKISQGGTAATIVDIKLVCKYAIESLASSVIFVHNHPSGNLTPSPQDLAFSRKIRDGLAMFEIKFLDSIIISDTGYYSMSDNGKL